jgi:LysM repeat protein
MPEGGLYPWKVQKIDTHRGPATNYRGVNRPLPPPPKNMVWVRDEKTREWSLVTTEADAVIDAEVIDDYDKESTDPFMEHIIKPTDTFEGVCLRYKVTPTELRQANRFSGTNLNLAPNPLRIPKKDNMQAATAVPVNRPTREQQISRVRIACPGLARTEAKCFLELNDWNVNLAIMDAQEDVAHDGDDAVKKMKV